MTVRFKIPRTADVAVAKVFSGVAKDYPIMQSASATALGGTQIPDALRDGDAWLALLNHKGYLLDSLSMRIADLAIRYVRGGSDEPKSPIFDEITLELIGQKQAPDLAARMAIQHRLQKELRAFEPDKVLGGTALEMNAQLVALQSSVFERLELIAEDVLAKSAEYRETLDNRYDEKLDKADAKNEELRAKLRSEYEQRELELRAREQTLADKLKEIDDRSNTHVRREIRDRMLDDVKRRIEQFGVSKETEAKRGPVEKGIFALAGLVMLYLGITVYEIVSLRNTGVTDTTLIFGLWARLTLTAIAGAGAILYYVKWQNRWAEQHATAEFQLQQFYIDVNRANWVVESCLEWTKETKKEVPPELLGSMAKGLFSSTETQVEQVLHPADTLASALMGTASKLRLRLGDNEMEFDKPGKLGKKEIQVKG